MNIDVYFGSPGLALREYYELERGTIVPPVQNLVAPNLLERGSTWAS